MNTLVKLIRPMLRISLCLATCWALLNYIDIRISTAPQVLVDGIFYNNYDKVFSVRSPRIQGMHGTGVLVKVKSGKSVILTNRHVCDAIGNTVLLTNGLTGGFSGVIYVDEQVDLCVIDFPASIDIAALKVEMITLKGNEISYSIGYPLEHDKSLTTGLVLGAVNLEVRSQFVDQTNCSRIFMVGTTKMCGILQSLIQTSVPTFPGSSGSPVFNKENKFIGLMNSAHPQSNFGAMIYLQDIIRVLNKF